MEMQISEDHWADGLHQQRPMIFRHLAERHCYSQQNSTLGAPCSASTWCVPSLSPQPARSLSPGTSRAVQRRELWKNAKLQYFFHPFSSQCISFQCRWCCLDFPNPILLASISAWRAMGDATLLNVEHGSWWSCCPGRPWQPVTETALLCAVRETVFRAQSFILCIRNLSDPALLSALLKLRTSIMFLHITFPKHFADILSLSWQVI